MIAAKVTPLERQIEELKKEEQDTRNQYTALKHSAGDRVTELELQIGDLQNQVMFLARQQEESNRLVGEMKKDRDHYVGIVDKALAVLEEAKIEIPRHPCGVDGCDSGLVHAIRNLVSKPIEKRIEGA